MVIFLKLSSHTPVPLFQPISRYYKEIAQNYCVYFNKITHATDAVSSINPDVIEDRTLNRSYKNPCPRCHEKECVSFQSDCSKAEGRMKLYYVCRNNNCKHRWTQ